MPEPKILLDADSPPDTVWQDFLAASTAGTLMQVVAVEGNHCHYEMANSTDAYDVPVLDFGHFVDDHHHGFIGDREMERLHAEASKLQKRGKLKLPHNRCVLLIRYQRESADPGPGLNLIFLSELDEGIAGTVVSKSFNRLAKATPIYNKWVVMPVDFLLEKRHNTVRGRATAMLDDNARNELGAFTQKQAQDVRLAMMLLRMKDNITIESVSSSISIVRKPTLH
jgi:hypothetical protein